jgi:hypothetical protein
MPSEKPSSNDLASPGSSTVLRAFSPYASALAYHASRQPRFRQKVFTSSAILPGLYGKLSLAASFRLWTTNVVEQDSWQVTRSTVPRCEVQVVMITPGYALVPLTGTPGPANAQNQGRSSRRYVDNEATVTTISLLSCCKALPALSCLPV